MTKTVIGGQALIEGVMFANATTTSSLVQAPDGTQQTFVVTRPQFKLLQVLKRIPFLRGVVIILETAYIGNQHMQFSSSVLEGRKEQTSSTYKTMLQILMYALVAIAAFFVSKILFTIIPVFLSQYLFGNFQEKWQQISIESGLKLLLLVGYILIVSRLPIIYRVLQFHGAEHMVIHAHEKGLPLTVENVKKQSRLHYRCGSSFMLFTIFVAFFLYFFVPIEPLWVRIVNRILLIPIVLGISYEVLRATNAVSQLPLLKYVGYPGLWLQLLTTRKPDDQQIAIAIDSFTFLLKQEQEQTASSTTYVPDGVSIDVKL